MRTINLSDGPGIGGKSHCVMVATSIVAGEVPTDNPLCSGPTFAASLIQINDECPTSEIRNDLLGALPWLLPGTRGTIKHEVTRAYMIVKYACDVVPKRTGNMHSVRAENSTNAALRMIIKAGSRLVSQYADVPDRGNHWDTSRKTDGGLLGAVRIATKAIITTACLESQTAGDDAAWAEVIGRYIRFVERRLIPVYTTMTIEHGYRMEKLDTIEVV
jgi:hypothetical protein